jgi:hypothetical protein
MLLARIGLCRNKQHHGKDGEREKRGHQRVGNGQGQRDLSPDPIALMVDRLLPKERDGHLGRAVSAGDSALQIARVALLGGNERTTSTGRGPILMEPPATRTDCASRQRVDGGIQHRCDAPAKLTVSAVKMLTSVFNAGCGRTQNFGRFCRCDRVDKFRCHRHGFVQITHAKLGLGRLRQHSEYL